MLKDGFRILLLADARIGPLLQCGKIDAFHAVFIQETPIATRHPEQFCKDTISQLDGKFLGREILFAHPIEKGDAVGNRIGSGRRVFSEIAVDFLVRVPFVDIVKPGFRKEPAKAIANEKKLSQIIEQQRATATQAMFLEPAIRQKPLAEGMQGPHIHLGNVVRRVRVFARHGQKFLQAPLQLLGGLFGKSRKEYFCWRNMPENNQIDTAPQQNARLSRSGTRREKQRAARIFDGKLLVVIGRKALFRKKGFERNVAAPNRIYNH